MGKQYFEVKKVEPAIYFLLSYGVALENYVAARVNLIDGLTHPGMLSAHQSIELLIKAILKLDPEKGHPRHHNLSELIKSTGIPEFSEFFTDDKIYFLDQLTKAHSLDRFGEAGISLDTDKFIDLLDEIIYFLWKFYLKKIKADQSKIKVPEDLRDKFLRKNACFKLTDISESPFNVPGM